MCLCVSLILFPVCVSVSVCLSLSAVSMSVSVSSGISEAKNTPLLKIVGDAAGYDVSSHILSTCTPLYKLQRFCYGESLLTALWETELHFYFQIVRVSSEDVFHWANHAKRTSVTLRIYYTFMHIFM